MKRQIVLVLALATALSTAVEAQLGGLIRKKAGEIVGTKKAAPAPAPTPAPTPTPAEPEPEPAPAPATPAAKTVPAGASAKAAESPLEASELPVRGSAVQVLRGRVSSRSNGDWNQLPSIPPAAAAAAYALGDSAQVALVETVGAALKALVMSPAFLAEHNESIKGEHKAVDHGIKGAVSLEDAMKKGDAKLMETIQARDVAAITVDQVRNMPPDTRKFSFTQQLGQWKTDAANPKRSNQAKLKKMIAIAQPIESLEPNDEKFIRGYAVILSIDNGGPDTEAALFALAERATREQQQLAYDEHNLRAQLRRQLTTFVAIASKVNFSAKTMEKNKTTVFVSAADEQQGALWKACFRAGPAPTAAAIKVARAWLAELQATD
jgi:hypothetical protein